MDAGGGNGHDAVDGNDDAAVARTLDFQETAFKSVEGTAMDADAAAAGEVELAGREVEVVGVVGFRHADEVAHLVVGDDDGVTATGFTAHEILKIGEFGLDGLDAARSST